MSDTHTHGLDDIACPERLVGECVIEREVAHAVAMERARVARFVEEGDFPGYWDRTFVLPRAIRNGAHDEGAR